MDSDARTGRPPEEGVPEHAGRQALDSGAAVQDTKDGEYPAATAEDNSGVAHSAATAEGSKGAARSEVTAEDSKGAVPSVATAAGDTSLVPCCRHPLSIGDTALATVGSR